jgi:hypothetical protein
MRNRKGIKELVTWAAFKRAGSRERDAELFQHLCWLIKSFDHPNTEFHDGGFMLSAPAVTMAGTGKHRSFRWIGVNTDARHHFISLLTFTICGTQCDSKRNLMYHFDFLPAASGSCLPWYTKQPKIRKMRRSLPNKHL